MKERFINLNVYKKFKSKIQESVQESVKKAVIKKSGCSSCNKNVQRFFLWVFYFINFRLFFCYMRWLPSVNYISYLTIANKTFLIMQATDRKSKSKSVFTSTTHIYYFFQSTVFNYHLLYLIAFESLCNRNKKHNVIGN